MHCGMCLPSCPTYELTGLEIHSPRGRIRMIKAVTEGELDLTDTFKESINFCLNCQACVTACPAGVEYGQLVESAKLHIEAHDKTIGRASRVKPIILNWLFTELSHLRFAGWMMKLYQITGLEFLVRQSGILKLVSGKLYDMAWMKPPVSSLKKYKMEGTHAAKPDKKKLKIGLLAGCVQDIFFRDVNQDTIDVLTCNGHDVFMPEKNSCCGSVHGHNGDEKQAKVLARKLIDDYEQANVDLVVLNSAGCGAYMKEYHHLLDSDPEYGQRAAAFVKKIRDITEFLVEYGYRIPESELALTVTYHEPCHLVHTQKVSQPPRKLITSLPGIRLEEMNESSWCCGSAGIYNITRYDDSMKVLARKMENIARSNAVYVVTGNPGCMIQLMFGVKKFEVDVRVIHPVSLLNMAYRKEREVQ